MQINKILVVPSGYTSFFWHLYTHFLIVFFCLFVRLFFLTLPKGVIFSVLSVSMFTHKTTELAFPEIEVKGDKVSGSGSRF